MQEKCLSKQVLLTCHSFNISPTNHTECNPKLDILQLLHYPDVYQPCKPVILQQTQVSNSLPMGVNYVDYEPQGTEVIQACLQTTP